MEKISHYFFSKSLRTSIFLTIFLAMFLSVQLLAGSVALAGPACGGPVGYTEIRTVQDFANINQNPTGSYKLCNNLDFATSDVFNIYFYYGTLDGQNYSISNFRTSNHGSYEGLTHIGLFSVVLSATIKNLKLLNVDLNFEGAYNSFTGGLAGQIIAGVNGENPSTIENVEVTGNIVKSTQRGVGLLAAVISDTTLRDITVTGTIESNSATVGGVAGNFVSSTFEGGHINTTIRHESGTDPLTITGNVGGVFASAAASVLRDLVVDTDIDHGTSVGGLVGSVYKTKVDISNSRVVVNITASNSDYTYAGGLVGRTDEGIPYPVTIIDTKVSGQVKGRTAGGLVGLALGPLIERSAFDSGSIMADTRGGGLVGYCISSPRIVDSYSKATIEKIDPLSSLSAGGLIGVLTGANSSLATIRNSYYAGVIGADTNLSETGGIIGYLNNPQTVVVDSVYFDQDLSNFDNGIGVGKTTQQMTTIQNTYVDWDFTNTWLFQNGQYPNLRVLAEENSCPGDFDGNGVIGVPDIFAFLSAWFAQSPATDFDGNGIIAVQDIFAFLSAWFAGC